MYHIIISRLLLFVKEGNADWNNISSPGKNKREREGTLLLTEEVIRTFRSAGDLSVRKVKKGSAVYTLLFLEGMTDKKAIHDYILSPLLAAQGAAALKNLLTGGKPTELYDETGAVNALLNGFAVIGDGETWYSVAVQNGAGRDVGEPATETVIRGSREGFTENAQTNAALIRRRLRSSRLKYEEMRIGELSQTQVILMWIDGIVNEKVLAELRARLKNVKTDVVFDSGELETRLQDGKSPLLPTVGNSERPDRVAAKLSEGRVAVIVSGSPVVLTVPYVFTESLQSTEDYSKSPFFASFLRLLRLSGLLVSVLLPAVFIALLFFHQTAIPLSLLETIAEAREGIPFSPFAETLFILLAFETVREVGIRMPRAVGNAVSLAAALVLGDSAVKAGIASTPVLIAAAMASIGSFIVPPMMNAVTAVRILLLFAARTAGFYGLYLVSAVLLIRLLAKSSFGIPYLSPLAPLSPTGIGDAVLMLPMRAQRALPAQITGKAKIRRKKLP